MPIYKGPSCIRRGGSMCSNCVLHGYPIWFTGPAGTDGATGPTGPTGAVYLGKMTVCKNAVSIKPPRYGY